MFWCRATLAGLLLVVLGPPLLLPLAMLFQTPQALQALTESARLLDLACNTALVVGGTLALSLPLGTALAWVLYRTTLPWAQPLRYLTFLAVLIPLPLVTIGWETALLALDLPLSPLSRVIWIHTIAGLPWVILLTGLGFTWVERELEEDALLATRPFWVVLKVTLPRCRAALLASAVWVAVLTATEITVTDQFQVRTFAEEVYTQMVRPESTMLNRELDLLVARAVAVSLPSIFLTGVLLVWAVRRWQARIPPLERRSPPWRFSLGRHPLFLLGAVCLVIGCAGGVPLFSLFWKGGVSGNPETWSWLTLQHQGRVLLKISGRALVGNLGVAILVGVLGSALGLVASWLAGESLWLRILTLGLALLGWTLPGPVVGLGMRGTIALLRDGTGSRWLAQWLYYGPSMAPIVWVQVVRLFPFAVALLWPVVRLVPRELLESVRVDGGGPLAEWRLVIWPLTRRVWLWSVVALTVLALGELSASKLVSTPNAPTFAERIFTQMHYTMGNDLAVQCLVMLALVVGLGGMLLFLGHDRSPLNR